MCMGVTHRTINTMVSFPIAGALLVQAHWHPLQAIVFLGGYTFATFLMNPDLDLDSLGYQSWGVLRFIWWPYQKALAHRCFLSHFPVVGTVCRIIYLMWVPILILLILGGTVQDRVRTDLFNAWPIIGSFVLLWILGMIISDTIHAILDVVSTDFKHGLHRVMSGGHHHHPQHGFFAHHDQDGPRHYNESYSRSNSHNHRRSRR